MTKILRHNPSKFGVKVDEFGYTSVSSLVESVNSQTYWEDIKSVDIIDVVNSDKKRYTLSGDLIKANYGHSFPVKHSESELPVPNSLYHGSNKRSLDFIKNKDEGIKPMDRHRVHLSEEKDFASDAAARRPNPILLRINTKSALRSGVVFTHAGNGVWLSTTIPPHCIAEIIEIEKNGE